MPGILSRPHSERIPPLELGGGTVAPLDVGVNLVLPLEWRQVSSGVGQRKVFPQAFPTRLSHEAFPGGFPTGLSHVPPWCESILGINVEALHGKQVSLEWTETSGGLWEWWHDPGVPLAFPVQSASS